MPGRLIRARDEERRETRCDAAEILAILFITGWLLSVVSTYTWNGTVHVLLVFAAIAIGVHFYQERRQRRRDSRQLHAKDCL